MRREGADPRYDRVGLRCGVTGYAHPGDGV